MDFTVLGATKLVAGYLAGGGAAMVVHAVVKNNIDPETKLDAVKVAAGSFVLGAVVSKIVKDHVNTELDKTVSTLAKWRNKINEKAAEIDAAVQESSVSDPEQ